MKKTKGFVRHVEEFDDFIWNTKILSDDLFEKFYDAYSYDAASTYNWLIEKLKIIQSRLDKGDILLFENNGKELNKNNFLDWIQEEFPNAKKDLL